MINLNIKKYVLIATLGMSMMLTGCTGEMINNIQYSQTDFSVKPDYVWDGSKSYFMNKIHEAGIKDSDYERDYTRQEFVEEFGTEIFTKDFQDKSSGVLGSLWWLTTSGSTGLMISQASGRSLWAPNFHTIPFQKFPKSEYPTKKSLIKFLRDGGMKWPKSDKYLSIQIKEYQSYYIYKPANTLRSKKSYLEVLNNNTSNHFPPLNLTWIFGESKKFPFIRQPHMIENGKIHFPIKP